MGDKTVAHAIVYEGTGGRVFKLTARVPPTITHDIKYSMRYVGKGFDRVAYIEAYYVPAYEQVLD